MRHALDEKNKVNLKNVEAVADQEARRRKEFKSKNQAFSIKPF